MPEQPLVTSTETQKKEPEQSRPLVDLGFLNPRSIRGKIIISLLVLYFLGSLAAVAALFSTSRVESKIEVIESFYELNQKILETRRHEKNFLLYGNNSDLVSALNYLEEVRTTINKPMESFFLSPDQEALTRNIELDEYARILTQLGIPQLPPTKAAVLKAQLRRLGHELTQVVFELDTHARQEVEKEARRYREMVLGILGTALMLGALLCIFLVRWIVQPLQAIRQATGRIMVGEMDTIPMGRAIRSSIEGVELVESLNKMLSALEAKQNQLIQSTKLAAIGKVTAGIAHEINNPLNNISLTAEVLLEDLPNLDCSERMEMVRDVLVQADRAREVVRHLLDFSRTRKPTVREKVNLLKLLSASMVLLKNQMRIAQVETTASFPEEPLLVLGNPNQLQQVLVNIILNGIQAMEPGGTLKLSASVDQENKKALLTISDTGTGIPVASQAQIFDPFFTTKNDGTGLGLSVSYAIIRDHHGDITLESSPDKGTTFRVVLPLLTEEE